MTNFYREFLDTSKPIANDIARAYADNNIEQLKDNAHKLKSSANTVGALRLGSVCLSLERAAKSGNQDQIEKAVSRFTELYIQTCKQITQNIDNAKS